MTCYADMMEKTWTDRMDSFMKRPRGQLEGLNVHEAKLMHDSFNKCIYVYFIFSIVNTQKYQTRYFYNPHFLLSKKRRILRSDLNLHSTFMSHQCFFFKGLPIFIIRF